MAETHTYLITGATGFLGSSLTTHLLALGHKVRAYARSEHGHESLRALVKEEHLPRLSSLLGAVEDLDRLRLAMRGVDRVIHAAAQKVVPLGEYDPRSCIKTNVEGTMNVALACLEAKVKRAAFISSDKASAPATVYGACKLASERSWLGANRYSAGTSTEYVAVRYGNCWLSSGSVIHAWRKAEASGLPIQITDPNCTRFHITLKEACKLILDALEHADPGTLWIPRLPSYRLGDLGNAFRAAYGIQRQPQIMGLRMAEKLHESMISEDESPCVRSEDEGHYVLEPGKVYRKGRPAYTSGSNEWRLSVTALKGMIEESTDALQYRSQAQGVSGTRSSSDPGVG